MIEKILMTLCLLAIAAIGCGSLMDNITPASIDPIAANYGEVKLEGITTLKDARQVQVGVTIKHRNVQTELNRLIEDDNFEHGVANQFINSSINEAEAFQDIIVGSPENPYSLLGLLAPLGFGTLIGKNYLKRKGDFSPEEVEVEKIKAKNDG